jgi:hypothetical protein
MRSRGFFLGRPHVLPRINLALVDLKSLTISACIALQCSIHSATIATSDGVRSAQEGPEKTVGSIKDT